MKIVITSGKKYIDIDAYAGIFAYRELLKKLGHEAYAVTTAETNESVPDLILDLGFNFDNPTIDDETKFIILDISNPDFLEDFVEPSRIAEIIDHHAGHEDYWAERNTPAQIEFIGSICTIIFEKFVENQQKPTPELCKLLTAGILDNTLNLKTSNTTKRDIDAYNQLLQIGGLDANWADSYFKACYQDLADNLEDNIMKSFKIEKFGEILPEIFGQMIFLKKEDILGNLARINNTLSGHKEWIYNAICLEDGKSYIICSDGDTKSRICKLLSVGMSEGQIISISCMLRKEIMKLTRDSE